MKSIIYPLLIRGFPTFRGERQQFRVNYITPTYPHKGLEPLNFKKVSGASVALDPVWLGLHGEMGKVLSPAEVLKLPVAVRHPVSQSMICLVF
jgi:hypothetical protein